MSVWLVADKTARIQLGLDIERGQLIQEGDILELRGACVPRCPSLPCGCSASLAWLTQSLPQTKTQGV